MNSYFESKLNPHANILVPDKVDDKDNGLAVPESMPQPQVVRPKRRPKTQMNEMLLGVDAPPLTQTAKGNQTGHMHTQTQAVPENHQNDILKITQRENDITALLVQQNLCFFLPSRNISVSDGASGADKQSG